MRLIYPGVSEKMSDWVLSWGNIFFEFLRAGVSYLLPRSHMCFEKPPNMLLFETHVASRRNWMTSPAVEPPASRDNR